MVAVVYEICSLAQTSLAVIIACLLEILFGFRLIEAAMDEEGYTPYNLLVETKQRAIRQ